MNSDAFQDKVVIVTGASTGIGKALAVQLAKQGAKLAIAARRVDLLQQVAEECRSVGGEVIVVPTDVSDEAQCQVLVQRTLERFGCLDMLINNAGMAATALFDDFPDLGLFHRTVNVNFYGAVYCTYYALPYLKKTKGRIVAISSLGGKAAIPYNTSYCASKHGLHGFYNSLRMELYQHGVSVTLVCPWWVATEFHAAQVNKDGVPRGAARGKDMYTSTTMSSERCAQITLNAANRRRREVLLGPGTLAVLLQLIAPRFLDWFAIKVFLEPAIRRAKAAQAKSDRN